jgi:dTDP-4-dehydrorhamnose reductase
LKRLVLIGSTGLLGSAFLNALTNYEVFPLGRKALERNTAESIFNLLVSIRPEIVLNCSAHTDVEMAEQNPQLDYSVNAQLPALIADACRKVSCMLVHFSSTGCYGDAKTHAYTEHDPLHPTTKHHAAKRDGENAIRESGCRYLIFRLGWLYGGAPKQRRNFVWNRLVEAASTSFLESDRTQMGCPTHVADVASQVMRVLEIGQAGTFNLVAHGFASRFDYVAEIVSASRLQCKVKPTGAYIRFAPVAKNEMAINQGLQQLGLDQMNDWRVPLRLYVQQLLLSPDWLSR